ncbi:MAG TPA: TadE/TadG family type IV pilus assembly protein [Candidatus Baltobacteraceae bacterium]|jgi:Flp pilus assembly protein TadG|nr:TadE/TadG family type IV pilus assembly protein [Candidatus Baltobacteraceae bacterium]
MTVKPRATEHQRGQVLAEFVTASMWFFMFLISFIDAGRAMFAYDLIENAAKVGARYAIVRGTSCSDLTPHVTPCPAAGTDVTAYVQAQSPGIAIPSGNVTTSWTWNPNSASGCPQLGSPVIPTSYQAPGCLVNVTVSYTFKFIWFSGLSVPMSSQAQMTIQQ